MARIQIRTQMGLITGSGSKHIVFVSTPLVFIKTLFFFPRAFEIKILLFFEPERNVGRGGTDIYLGLFNDVY